MDDRCLSRFGTVTLEMSLKPFVDLSSEGIEKTCALVATNWERLCERADQIAVLWWVSDGNEIFEWHGDLDEELIWAQYVGFCNFSTPGMFPQENRHYRINQAVPYREDTPEVTFGHLRIIMGTLRRVLQERMDKPVVMGATVDPGPEFAPARFKVEAHPEILIPNLREKSPMMMHFMTHQAMLKADPRPYGGFPDGIPEGTSFGYFLGKQFQSVSEALGFDYIWLSNGFGYTHFPWGFHGETFNGQAFLPDRAGNELDKLRQFWMDFRRGCPDKPVQVRGTNFTVGMDISSDACSHQHIADLGDIVGPPCNPPWGSRALGMEMASYLSRLAHPYTERMLFRFYLNDPWFVSNPWYDRYGREAYDIYVPMACSRITSEAEIESPNDLAFLTIDTNLGDLSTDQANEVTPHLVRALDERPDAPGPIIWVYPWAEYHALLDDPTDELGRPMSHDFMMVQFVNAGLPVNTVMTTETFCALQQNGKLPEAIYVMPVPNADWPVDRAVTAHLEAQGQVMFYGSARYASGALLGMLGLTLDDREIDGDVEVVSRLAEDDFARPVQAPVADDPSLTSVGIYEDQRAEQVDLAQRPLRHRAVISDGGMVEVADEALVGVSQAGAIRAYAVSRDVAGGGKAVWLRSTGHCDPSENTLEMKVDPPWQVRLTGDWMRHLLGEFGWEILNERHDERVRPANLFIKRHRGAFYFVGHKSNTTARMRIRTPYGAPAYDGMDTAIESGRSIDQFGRTFYNEVRVFVDMPNGIVTNQKLPVPLGKQAHFCLSNLVAATVRIFPDPQCFNRGSLAITSIIKGEEGVPFEADEQTRSAVVKNYTGALYIVW